MRYIVFEYDLANNVFGKVLKRNLKKEDAKKLALKLGKGHTYGEQTRMLIDFNLK